MSTHNLCFEQKYENHQNFWSENFQFLMVKFSVYLNRHVFVMMFTGLCLDSHELNSASSEIRTRELVIWSWVPLGHPDTLTCLRWMGTYLSEIRVTLEYLNNPKYWDRQAWANSVDPDQMLQNLIWAYTVCHSSSSFNT